MLNNTQTPQTKISLNEVQAEFEKTSEIIGLFKLRTANKTIDEAKSRPIPKMLFGELWFETELCIFFADTNLGKSILAVQIADSITTKNHVEPFRMEAKKQKVLYFDFELSDKQFETRYADDNYKNHYRFNDDLLRLEIDAVTDIPEGVPFESYINLSIEQTVKQTGAKILIIDNITFLRHDNEKAKDALVLMKHLKKLKEKYQLSILILAHTPKRDLGKPLSRNDLSGSSMLMNFADSSFALGRSYRDEGLRYLKQIKERNTEKKYPSDFVPVFRIDKNNDNFLGFEFIEFSEEKKHLKRMKNKDKALLMDECVNLHNAGHSLRSISMSLGISKSTVSNYLKKAGVQVVSKKSSNNV